MGHDPPLRLKCIDKDKTYATLDDSWCVSFVNGMWNIFPLDGHCPTERFACLTTAIGRLRDLIPNRYIPAPAPIPVDVQ